MSGIVCRMLIMTIISIWNAKVTIIHCCYFLHCDLSHNTGGFFYFINCLRAHGRNLAKICIPFAWNIMILTGHNFARVTTAELSWHVQSCDPLAAFQLKSEQKEFTQDFNYELINHLWDRSRYSWERKLMGSPFHEMGLQFILHRWYFSWTFLFYPLCASAAMINLHNPGNYTVVTKAWWQWMAKWGLWEMGVRKYVLQYCNMESWHPKSLATPLFVQTFVEVYKKSNLHFIGP